MQIERIQAQFGIPESAYGQLASFYGYCRRHIGVQIIATSDIRMLRLSHAIAEGHQIHARQRVSKKKNC